MENNRHFSLYLPERSVTTVFCCTGCGDHALVTHFDARDYDTGQRRPEGWDYWGPDAFCHECAGVEAKKRGREWGKLHARRNPTDPA